MIHGKETCSSCRRAIELESVQTTLVRCPHCNAQLVPSTARRVALLTRRAGADPAFLEELSLPQAFLERYRLLRLLGVGGMGTVYAAFDQSHRAIVAVKFLTRRGSDDVTARFVREGELMMQIHHPNLLRVREVDEIEGFPYLVTEYVEGGSLRDLLRERRVVKQAEAVRIMLECLGALTACHSRGIVHRDFKPENVLLTRTLRARVADLGIAKDYGRSDRAGAEPAAPGPAGLAVIPVGAGGNTTEGALIGTPQYMSPEQIRGEPVVVASDVYSAGVVLYEMLCGHPPFKADTLADLFRQIASEEPTPIQSLVPELAEPVAIATGRALSRRLEDRIANAEDFAAILRRVKPAREPQQRADPAAPAPMAEYGPVRQVPRRFDDAPVSMGEFLRSQVQLLQLPAIVLGVAFWLAPPGQWRSILSGILALVFLFLLLKLAGWLLTEWRVRSALEERRRRPPRPRP